MELGSSHGALEHPISESPGAPQGMWLTTYIKVRILYLKGKNWGRAHVGLNSGSGPLDNTANPMGIREIRGRHCKWWSPLKHVPWNGDLFAYVWRWYHSHQVYKKCVAAIQRWQRLFFLINFAGAKAYISENKLNLISSLFHSHAQTTIAGDL